MNASTAQGRKPNALAGEKSPYLLQHQFNPVAWEPWGPTAFERARAENKPVFLSIGYSTCHWCHVMERESFEDEAVADFLNRHFISIKVDREERPDVDKIYMTFVQATTGQGGWPLNVFLTPELKPFFGGTYFPPDNRYGRPTFLAVLKQVQQAWTARHSDLEKSAREMHQRLEGATAAQLGETGDLDEEVLRNAGRLLKEHFDPVNGGFGRAPKFPQPSHPRFLLRYAHRFGDDEATQMVLRTCSKMAAGGIHDQLGGGFSRYSVDEEWLVPHFEKMLYDNAQLIQLYLDAWLISGDEEYSAVVRDVAGYVLRDMTDPEGGFYSAEDADSEGHEGKFYCWTAEELRSLLTPDEYAVAARCFRITEQGNFVDHSHPEPLKGQNVLSLGGAGPSVEEEPLLESAKRKMFAARERRVRPHRDDKVLASWNGMMLGAIARASAVLGEPSWRSAAEKNLAFLKARLWDPQTRLLYHRWRDGERDQVQLLEAYAFMLDGVLDLYEASLIPAHLEFAIALAESMVGNFYDSERGGFWQTGARGEKLILRLKEDYDGAEPSGNSAAVLALFRLAAVTGNTAFREIADKTLHAFSARLRDAPHAVPYMLQALDFSLGEPARATLSGPAGPERERLLRTVHSVYLPNRVVLGTEGPVEPFARTLPADKPMLYLCRGTSCQAPTDDPVAIRKLLS